MPMFGRRVLFLRALGSRNDARVYLPVVNFLPGMFLHRGIIYVVLCHVIDSD